ncbi:1689_t:CDS:2, partial [Funneliformis geosporum]
NNSILFVEQLVTSKGDSMLSYYNLSTQPGFPHTRRIPKWFLILQEIMFVDQGARITRHNYPHSNNHVTPSHPYIPAMSIKVTEIPLNATSHQIKTTF